MKWGSFSNFADMGGYALYVWGAYFMTVVCIVVELIGLARRRRAVARERAPEGEQR